MTSAPHSPAPGTPAGAPTRHLPPIVEVALLSVALVLASGIDLAAHLPGRPPLALPTGLVAGAAALSLVAMGLLSHIRPFAWDSFFLVAKWALLAYFVIGGLLLFVFIHDHTTGRPLMLLTASLLVFAIDVPMILAFTVAKYADAPAGAGAPAPE